MEVLKLSWDLHELENETLQSVVRKIPIIYLSHVTQVYMASSPRTEELRKTFRSLFSVLQVVCDFKLPDLGLDLKNFPFDVDILYVIYQPSSFVSLHVRDNPFIRNIAIPLYVFSAIGFSISAKNISSLLLPKKFEQTRLQLLVINAPSSAITGLLHACSQTLVVLKFGKKSDGKFDLREFQGSFPQLKSLSLRAKDYDKPLLAQELPELLKDHEWVLRFPRLERCFYDPSNIRSYAAPAAVAGIVNRYYFAKMLKVRQTTFLCLQKRGMSKDICRFIVSKYVKRIDFYDPDLSWSMLLPILSQAEAKEKISLLLEERSVKRKKK